MRRKIVLTVNFGGVWLGVWANLTDGVAEDELNPASGDEVEILEVYVGTDEDCQEDLLPMLEGMYVQTMTSGGVVYESAVSVLERVTLETFNKNRGF